ncbi:hypothetical protein LOD99_1032 [Oopsacas minuta]|uniref:RING-type E3 ubiquitin transferase n=1 Tax=Oopsacas minuta TaxID=111878 RepID=A0AAV7K0B9_9METZ|nr:hypothetical protein LOD99_1032 [Oopsacas minuta]
MDYYAQEAGASSSDITDSSLTPSQELEDREYDLREESIKYKLVSETTNADISSRPWDWAQSPEFIPNQLSHLTDPDTTADQNGMISLSKDSNGELLTSQIQSTQSLIYSPYQTTASISYADAAKKHTLDYWGYTTYDDSNTRYEQCDMCMEFCLDSWDTDQQKEHRRVCTAKIEQEMEDAFAYQRSEEKVCAICYEEVLSKSFSERRFGILLGCLHVFCLSCIRKWRTNSGGDKNAVRSCPLCRTHSDYVIPSIYWVEETEDKLKLITQYQKKLSNIACRYFDEGMGTCPFGNNCFYMHAFPNGEVHKEKIRKYGNSEGEVTIIQPVCLSQFIQERDNRGFS